MFWTVLTVVYIVGFVISFVVGSIIISVVFRALERPKTYFVFMGLCLLWPISFVVLLIQVVMSLKQKQ